MSTRGVLALLVGVPLAIAACGLSAVGQAPTSGGDDGAGDAAPRVEASLPKTSDDENEDAGVLDGTVVDGAPASCPPTCTGGCVGTECRIVNPSSSVTCPPDKHCRVECGATQVCQDIDCGGALSCTVECKATQACNSISVSCRSAACVLACSGTQGCNGVSIDPGTSPALCVSCGGVDGCKEVKCTTATPGTKCSGISCGEVTKCGPLTPAVGCP